MPALRMKSKPSTGSSREGPNLNVCCSSTIISKGSHVLEKTVQQAVLDKCVNTSQNASNFDNLDDSNSPTESVDHRDFCAGAADQISDLPLPSPEHTSIDKTVPYHATCPSILETIFSPNFENGETETNATCERNEVVDDEHTDLPHLVTDDSDDSSCSPHGYQYCSVSDYNVSDLTVPAFSCNGSMGFSDLICSASPDYDHIYSELTFDMEERYMMLPFPEKNLETNNMHDGYNDDFVMNMDDSYLYFAIHQLKSPEQQTEISFHSSDVEEALCFDPHLYIKMPETEMASSTCAFQSQKETEKKHVTLVLDLDETLVHSTLDHCDDADFSFLVFFNMKEHTVYVRQRPYLHAFLERVAQMFEIVIFTASQSIYAEKLLDILDPNKKLISHRVYRESCIFSEGSYTKDLTVLGIDLARVAIIDNTPQVFRLQVNNGIPIKSWFDDPSDNALISLLPFLETLVDVEDVRPIIAKRFSNKE